MIRRLSVAIAAAMISCAPVRAEDAPGCFPTQTLATALANPNGIRQLTTEAAERVLNWFNAKPPQTDIHGLPVFAKDLPDARALYVVIADPNSACLFRFVDAERETMLRVINGTR
jgi:hypothetical protein